MLKYSRENSRPSRAVFRFKARLLLSALLLASLGCPNLVRSQEYMFTTLAGSGGPGAIDGPGANARFNYPEGVATDKTGNLYVADSLNATIRKIAPDGTVTTLAGLAENSGFANGTGGNARFSLPSAMVVDTTGN